MQTGAEGTDPLEGDIPLPVLPFNPLVVGLKTIRGKWMFGPTPKGVKNVADLCAEDAPEEAVASLRAFQESGKDADAWKIVHCAQFWIYVDNLPADELSALSPLVRQHCEVPGRLVEKYAAELVKREMPGSQWKKFKSSMAWLQKVRARACASPSMTESWLPHNRYGLRLKRFLYNRGAPRPPA